MCGAKGQSSQTSNSKNSFTPTGLPQLQNIYNVANAASQIPYVPYPGQLVAPVNQEQMQAGSLFNMAPGMAQPYINASAGLFGQSAQNPNTNGLIQSFYNPMASNVMANLNEVFGQQMNETTGNLQQAAGGIGADRIAVGQAELARQQGLAAGQTMAGLYGQAVQAAQGQQGLQQAAGFGFGQLGPAAEQALLTGANAELGFGTLQQQTQQNQLNAQYQQFLRQQGYPFQTGQYLAGIGIPAASAMGGTGVGMSQGTYTPAQPSPISQGVQAGMAILPFLAKGGRVKHYDTGGDVFGETQFDVNGYVPKQSQPIQAAPYSGMPMGMAMNNPALMNSMAGFNPMTGSAGNASMANNPMSLAKQYQDIYKQGQAAAGGLKDVVNKFLDSDMSENIGEDTRASLTGWANPDASYGAGASADTGTAARGGAINGYASGGSPNLVSMMFGNSAPSPFTRMLQAKISSEPTWQLQQEAQPPPAQSLQTLQDVGTGLASRDPSMSMSVSNMGQADLMQQLLARQQSQSQPQSHPQSQAAPSPFVTQTFDPAPVGQSTFPMGMQGGSMPDMSSLSQPNTPFQNTIDMTPSWVKNLHGPQQATNAANGSVVPFAAGGVAHYDVGGSLNDITSMAYDVLPGGYLTNYAKQWASGDPMARYRDAIAHVESAGKGDYSAVNPDSHALGRYQVMPQYLKPWLKEAGMDPMTSQQFLNDHDAQDKLFNFKFGQSLDKYGNPQDAASVWFSGRPLAHNGSIDQWTGLSVPGYVGRFNNALRSQGSGSGAPTDMGANASLEFAGAPSPNTNSPYVPPPNTMNMAQTPSSSPFGATGAAGAMPPPQNAVGAMAMQRMAAPSMTHSPGSAPAGAPDYEQAYLQGQIHGTSPFGAAGGGSIRGYSAGGGPGNAIPSDTDDPITDFISKKFDIPPPGGNHVVTPPPPPSSAPKLDAGYGPVMGDSGGPQAPVMANSLGNNTLPGASDTDPSPFGNTIDKDSSIASYALSPNYMPNPDEAGGKSQIYMQAHGSDVNADPATLGPDDNKPNKADTETWYGKHLDAADAAAQEVARRSQIPTIPTLFHGDQPMTGWRRMMLGMAAGMGNSSWAIPNIAKGLGSGMQSLDTGAKDYLDLANENLKAQQMVAELGKPVSMGLSNAMYDPRYGTIIGGANPADIDNPNNPIYRQVTKGALDNAANLFIKTGQLPSGLSRTPQILLAVQNRADQMLREQYGDSDAGTNAILANRARMAGIMAGARTAGVGAGRTIAAQESVQGLVPQAIQLSKELENQGLKTSYPNLNKLLMDAASGMGNDTVTRLAQFNNNIVNDYVTAMARSGGAATEGSKERAQAILNYYWANGQYEKGLRQLQFEMDNAKRGNLAAINEIGSLFGQQADAIGGKGTAAALSKYGLTDAGSGGGKAYDAAIESPPSETPPPQYPNAKRGVDGRGWFVQGIGKVGD